MECKICKDTHNEVNDPLISPCKCIGTMHFVHRKCIETWVNTSGSDVCPECRQTYTSQVYYRGLFFPEIMDYIDKYNYYYVRYYKFPLVILAITYLFLKIFLFEYIISPLFLQPLTLTSLCCFIVTKYIIFFLASFSYNISFIRDRYDGFILISSVFFNCTNISLYLYQKMFFLASSYSFIFLQYYTYYSIMNSIVAFVRYFEQDKVDVLYVTDNERLNREERIQT